MNVIEDVAREIFGPSWKRLSPEEARRGLAEVDALYAAKWHRLPAWARTWWSFQNGPLPCSTLSDLIPPEPPGVEDDTVIETRVAAAAETYQVGVPIPDVLGYAMAFSREHELGNAPYNAWVCALTNGAARPNRTREERR